MGPTITSTTLNETEQTVAAPPATRVVRATLLYEHRRLLGRVTAIALLMSLGNRVRNTQRYTAVTIIMPPDQQGSGAMLLAPLAARSGGLGSLAGGLLSSHHRGTLCRFVGEWGCRR